MAQNIAKPRNIVKYWLVLKLLSSTVVNMQDIRKDRKKQDEKNNETKNVAKTDMKRNPEKPK